MPVTSNGLTVHRLIHRAMGIAFYVYKSAQSLTGCALARR